MNASSPLRRAQLERGWSETEAAARVRELCRNGDQCGMNADRLHDLELGLFHPGAAHADALSRLFGRDPAELGLRIYDATDETKE